MYSIRLACFIGYVCLHYLIIGEGKLCALLALFVFYFHESSFHYCLYSIATKTATQQDEHLVIFVLWGWLTFATVLNEFMANRIFRLLPPWLMIKQ